MSRAVLFDVDGVLLDGFHERPEGLKRWDQFLASDLGIDPDLFASQFIRPLYVPYVLTRQKSLANALEEALPALGFAGSPMDIIRAWMQRDTRTNGPLLDAIARLRLAGAHPYVVTNQEDIRANNLWMHLGFREMFVDILYSARLGAAKPDPAFFAGVDARLGPQAEPPLFFDDYASIVAAATTHGWEAVRFDSNADFFSHPWVAAQLDAVAEAG